MKVSGKLVGYAGVLAVTFAAAYAIGGAVHPLAPAESMSPTAVEQMSAQAGPAVGRNVARAQDGDAAAGWQESKEAVP